MSAAGTMVTIMVGIGELGDVRPLEPHSDEAADVQRAVVEQLEERDALASGLDVATATDILWTLNHPTVWHLLVRERSWSAEQYERWLGDAFCSQLLPESTTRSPAS